MQVLLSVMLGTLLAPATIPPGGANGAKSKPPIGTAAAKPSLAPLLSDAALGALAKAAGATKAPTVEIDQRTTLSTHVMSSGGASIDYSCVGKISGVVEIAYWYQYFIDKCPAAVPASATVTFPVAAGRVYVVNCQASDNTWTLARYGASGLVGEEQRVRSIQPSIVVAATTSGSVAVRFGLAHAESGNNPEYYLGKCQVARVAL